MPTFRDIEVVESLAVDLLDNSDPAKTGTEESRANRLYETILATTDDFAYIFDPQGRFLYANARLLKVYARTLDEVVGKTCHELGYPTWHADMHMREILEIVRTKKPIRNEVPFTGDSGISGIYDYIFQPVLDKSGNVEVIVGTTRDITERKRNEEQLKSMQAELKARAEELQSALAAKSESEEALLRIASVVEFSEDAIIGKSLDGIIMTWNAGAQRVFGYTPDEIIGKSILVLIPPELQKEEPVIINKLKNGERVEHYETIRLGKGGRKIDVSLTVSPIKDSSGKVIGASKIARDITEEKKRQQAEREREAQFRTELERLVGERTASLREAVAQMEEFSYSVSHDLRAPLRAMQGFATALLEDYRGKVIDAEGEDYLKRIVNAGMKMDRLTRDVLVYSKIPRTEMLLCAVSLDTLVSDIIQQYIFSKAVSADIVIEAPLLSVMGNESFLAQAISNLVDNAVKFAANDRPIQVRIRTEAHQDQVRLWVEDNGIGIESEHQHRIWGMFERVHPQDLYEGTGIGLAIVRKTIERMNGTMGVESDGSTGSRFWIQLPGL